MLCKEIKKLARIFLAKDTYLWGEGSHILWSQSSRGPGDCEPPSIMTRIDFCPLGQQQVILNTELSLLPPTAIS